MAERSDQRPSTHHSQLYEVVGAVPHQLHYASGISTIIALTGWVEMNKHAHLDKPKLCHGAFQSPIDQLRLRTAQPVENPNSRSGAAAGGLQEQIIELIRSQILQTLGAE
jgi:hypothetical protein